MTLSSIPMSAVVISTQPGQAVEPMTVSLNSSFPENVSAYYLEFDDERSGGFEPLRYVAGDKKVVLGLITS